MAVQFLTEGAQSIYLHPAQTFDRTTLESVKRVGAEEVRKEIARNNAGNIITDAGIRGSKLQNRLTRETFQRISSELRNGEIDLYL